MYSSSAAASKKRVKIALGRFVNNNDLLAGLGSHEHLKGGLQEGGGSASPLAEYCREPAQEGGDGGTLGSSRGLGGACAMKWEPRSTPAAACM